MAEIVMPHMLLWSITSTGRDRKKIKHEQSILTLIYILPHCRKKKSEEREVLFFSLIPRRFIFLVLIISSTRDDILHTVGFVW